MSELFRGEEMTLCQIYFQSEAVYSCVAQLGELGIVQFRDLNPNVNAFQRKFVNEVRRCEEMERKLRFLEKEILKENEIAILEPQEICDAPKPKEMIDLEATLEQLEHDLREVNLNKDALNKNYLELKELKHILTKATTFFEEVDSFTHHRKQQQQQHQHGRQRYSNNRYRENENVGFSDSDNDNSSLLQNEHHTFAIPLSICFIAGVIPRDRVPTFELMLWRICRGNVLLRTAEIDELTEDPTTNDLVNKTVFILFFQGEQLRNKVKKICEGFRATVYPCPDTAAERREMSVGVLTRLEELKTVLDQSSNLRKTLLRNAAVNLRTWVCRVRKMKAIYHTMNLFNIEVNQKCLIAECWAPVNELSRIRLALDKGTELSGGTVPSILNRMNTREQPPTHHRSNKFTQAFQNIVDAYGVASYREINPAPFTVITFPFLFAVMFGDAGHGLIMLLFALFMVLREKSLKNVNKNDEIWQTFFGGRYIILLMAIFSIYTGFIYNDVFSKSINVFGSSWRVGVGKDFQFNQTSQFFLNPDPSPASNNTNAMYNGNSYPFGIDPVWQLAINKITFTNSLKMKFSVIIGIMQMIFGLVLGFLNHLYFNNSIGIYFEFIPQIVFMVFIFGYLCLMIFIKWIKYSGAPSDTTGPGCAPNLLIELINMFFLSTSADTDCKVLYPGQGGLQKFLIIAAILCIPVMLVAKPLILYIRNKKKSESGVRLEEDVRDFYGVGNGTEPLHSTNQADTHVISVEDTLNLVDDHEHEAEFDFSEIVVEQCIHTIEYFLGCISHTASYLRLWALSLAHAQLSEVLWTMVLRLGININGSYGFIILFYVFAIWAGFTVVILCLMEGLSAFLHALRLHWIEFQTKFYKGEGYLFIPFSFTTILNEAEENEAK